LPAAHFFPRGEDVILIVTEPADPHAAAVETKLKERGARVARFDPADFPRHATLALSYDGLDKRARLRTAQGTLELGEVRAAWLRRPGKPVLHETLRDPEFRRWAQLECVQQIQDLWDALDTAWLPGQPWAIRRADSKHLQLQLAAELGFEIPPTLITTDRDALLEFHRRHGGRIIDKMPSVLFPLDRNGPIFRYTQLVSTRDIGYASRVRHAPMLFQAYVEKRFELRITVVGGRVLACEIHSQATNHTRDDWRRYDHAHTPHRVHRLPPEEEARCLALVSRLGLRFGAIDMVVTPDGRYVFLEINPNGQWLWIEQQTGLPIADAVCDALMESTR
jgi:hypothetical protein